MQKKVMGRAPALLRFGPRLEASLAVPDDVSGVEGVVVALGPLEQMKFDETRRLVKVGCRVKPFQMLLPSPPSRESDSWR